MTKKFKVIKTDNGSKALKEMLPDKCPSRDDKMDDNIDGTFKERLIEYHRMSENPNQYDIAKEHEDSFEVGAVIGEDEFEVILKCPCCGGDGKETCTNPDHGFLNEMSFHEIGRLGCPVCGHDENHKVKNGGNCDVCNGTGKISNTEFEIFLKDYNYDNEPQLFAIPKKKEDERELSLQDFFEYFNQEEIFFRFENDETGFYLSIISRKVYPRIWADNAHLRTVICESTENIINRTVLGEIDWKERYSGETIKELLADLKQHYHITKK